MTSNIPEDIGGAFLASLSGVIVALVGQYLQVRHENENQRRLYRSARRMMSLEVENNRSALEVFWSTVNGLDSDRHQDSAEHLAAMLGGGLLGYDLPQWSFVRWDRLEAEAFAAFTESELAGIDQMNRTLRTVTDLYSSLTTLTADDNKRLQANMGGRFWTQDLARERCTTYDKLAAAVASLVAAPSPMGK